MSNPDQALIDADNEAQERIEATSPSESQVEPNGSWPEKGIRPHPIAAIFRMMDETELAELATSIGENGLREPIVIYEGRILDGRNRYLAAIKAGLFAADIDWRYDPHFVSFAGMGWPKDQLDPLEFVWDHNFNRRHDDKAQRAMAAARYHERRQGFRSDLTDAHPATLREVATRAGVSERLVTSAHTVIDHGAPELVEAVEQGRLPLHTAEKAARELDRMEQRVLAEYPDKKTMRAAAKKKLAPAPELPSPMSRADLASFAEEIVAEARRVALKHGGKGASLSADAVLDAARDHGVIEAGDGFPLSRPMLLVLGKLRDQPEGPKAAPEPPPAPSAREEYDGLVALDLYKGKHTPKTAEPILRAGVAAGIKRKQIGVDIGHPTGTISTWCNRLGLQDHARLTDPERPNAVAKVRRQKGRAV